MYGNHHGNIIESFGKTADGGFYFSGYTLATSGLFNQGFIQKTDKNGKVEWYHEYGGKYDDKFLSAHQTSDGGFIAVGITSSLALDTPQLNYNYHAYIVKTDAQGNETWQKVFGGRFYDSFWDVAETPDHNFVATGAFDGISGNNVQQWLYVVKVKQNGDSIWTCNTPQFRTSYGLSLAIANDGSIGVTGNAQKTDTSLIHPLFGYLSANGKLIKPVIVYDSIVMHNDQYDNDLNPIKYEKIISVPGGFMLICGGTIFPNTGSFPIGGNVYMQSIIVGKIDYNGSFVWSHPFTGQGNGVDFSDAFLNPDGSLLISGNVPNSAWVLNLNASGIKTSEIFIPGIGFAEGGVADGNSYALGLSLDPLTSSHSYYFGLAIADQNGKIK